MRLTRYIKELKWDYILIEIIIVTVGILIAFKVDKWREQSNKDNQELGILKEFHMSLTKDIQSLNNILNRNDSVIISATILQRHLLQARQISDSIQIHAVRATSDIQLNLRTSVYDNLKSIGLGLISNDAIKIEIATLYDFQYPRQLEMIKNYGDPSDTSFPLDKFEFKYSVSPTGTVSAQTIISPRAFSDKRLLYYVTERLEAGKEMKWRMTTLKQLIEQLVKNIELEITSRE